MPLAKKPFFPTRFSALFSLWNSGANRLPTYYQRGASSGATSVSRMIWQRLSKIDSR
jgi:hypothetical protein